MRKIKLVSVRQSKAKIALRNQSQIYQEPLQTKANNFAFEQTQRYRHTIGELEIDIALSCLNACKYLLIWIIGLCLYSSL